MDNINFSSPNGFPLEADATLGFMQNNYVTSARGLGAAFGDYTIISGLLPNGLAVSDGWIYLNNDLIFFEGGAVASSFYIEITVIQKANENGLLYDRYYKKRAKFGTHPTLTNYNFSSFKRLENQRLLQMALISILQFGEDIILSGCEISVNSGVFDIQEGLVLLGGKLLRTPSVFGMTSPQYLVVDESQPDTGKFVSILPASVYIMFSSVGTSQFYSDVLRRKTALIGEVRMVAVAPTAFDSTGLGIGSMKGWAVCNGANGTYDMRGKMPVGFSLGSTKYEPLGNQGGAESVQIGIANMPAHNHSVDNTTNAVIAGDYGLMRKSINGELKTISGNSVDAQDSGVQADLTAAPVRIPMQGNGQPISIVSPYTTLLFIQRI